VIKPFIHPLNSTIDMKLPNEMKKELRILLLVASGKITNVGVHQGIGILAAICDSNNVFVKCIDYRVEPTDYEELKDIIKREKINFVGITSQTCSAKYAYRLAEAIKCVSKNILTIMGGPHASALPDEPLTNSIDIVVIGEGEGAFADICHNFFELQKKSPSEKIGILKRIRSIAFLDINKKIIKTKMRKRIRDLDVIPWPARHHFAFPEKYRTLIRAKTGHSVNIMTSRGCSEKCLFCCRIGFKSISFRSPENVINEIEYLLNTYDGIKQVDFIDENLLYSPEHIRKIGAAIREKNMPIVWGGRQYPGGL